MSKDYVDTIIGMGEIGSGLKEFIEQNTGEIVFGLDLDSSKRQLEVVQEDSQVGASLSRASVSLDSIADSTRVLHICIPGNIPNFVPVVSAYIQLFSPEMAVIHSTVPVGTTTKLQKAAPEVLVVHSPVRGKHPHMVDGLKAYAKYIGLPKDISMEDWKYAVNIFNGYGFKTKVMSSPEATELAKILSTTRYGVNLLFADMQKELIDSYGLNYSQVVIDWEQTYNEGLKEVGLEKYTRPILTPPKGDIGGHCVYENAVMLLNTSKGFLKKIDIFLKAIKHFGRENRNGKK